MMDLEQWKALAEVRSQAIKDRDKRIRDLEATIARLSDWQEVALSPALPDDVVTLVRDFTNEMASAEKRGYSDPNLFQRGIDLLERQQREILGLERINLELAIDSQVPDLLEHIEQLEATVEAFRENRAGQYLKRIEQLQTRLEVALEIKTLRGEQ